MGLFGGGKPRKQLRDTNLNANVSVKKAKTKKIIVQGLHKNG